MTHPTDTQGSPAVEFTTDEINAAAAQEQAELDAAQQAHLRNRVITLRAAVVRLEAEVAELRAAAEGDESDEPDEAA